MNTTKLIPLAAVVVVALAGTVLIVRGSDAPAAQAAAATDAERVVYKSPTCGCCGGWVDHMREAGYDLATVDVPEYEALVAKKAEHGVPNDLGSCHTASIDGYTIEGHVPAELVARLLRERPSDIRGLSAPGMPVGSPGMEGPNPEPYDVIAFRKDGSRVVYETVYPGQPISETR